MDAHSSTEQADAIEAIARLLIEQAEEQLTAR